jgi:hypothetical protein
MTPSALTLLINGVLILVGIVLTVIMLRMGAIHDYNYGVSDVQRPLRRWIIIILLVLLFMSFAAAVYNLIGPWVFGI